MTPRERRKLEVARRELGRQLRLIRELACVVHTHVRTDLPPDAAMPRMERLLKKIGGRR